jgi:hypothetical protein
MKHWAFVALTFAGACGSAPPVAQNPAPEAFPSSVAAPSAIPEKKQPPVSPFLTIKNLFGKTPAEVERQTGAPQRVDTKTILFGGVSQPGEFRIYYPNSSKVRVQVDYLKGRAVSVYLETPETPFESVTDLLAFAGIRVNGPISMSGGKIIFTLGNPPEPFSSIRLIQFEGSNRWYCIEGHARADRRL